MIRYYKHMELTIRFENEDVKVRGDVDKSTGFIFYTCTFENKDKIVLSGFDGNVLKFANHMGKNEMPDLDKLIECVNDSLFQ